MVQKGILDAKIKKFVDREEILEENLKRASTILHGQCNDSLLAKMREIENMKTSSVTKMLFK